MATREKGSLRSFSSLSAAFMQVLPEEMRAKVGARRAVERILDQFGSLVSSYIRKHVNSVYLLRPEADVPANVRNLIVYVDDSMVAAELNARRELIKLRYREQFAIVIDQFDIRISKGRYLSRHPYLEREMATPNVSHETPLSREQLASIEECVGSIEDDELRESFKRAMEASFKRQKPE